MCSFGAIGLGSTFFSEMNRGLPSLGLTSPEPLAGAGAGAGTGFGWKLFNCEDAVFNSAY